MTTFTFISIIFILIAGPFLCNCKQLDLECDVTQEHFTSKSCSMVITVCNMYDSSWRDNNAHLLFTNANTEDFTSFVASGRKLPRFPTEIFEQFPNLIHVKLEYGFFREIPEHTFKNAYKLMELELPMNKIQEITDTTFISVGKLIKLDLYRNEIKQLPAKAFRHLSNLEYLRLAYNELRFIHEDTFSHLKNLKTLILSHNDLRTLDTRSFVHNHKLLFLELGHNSMYELELEFESVHLHTLDLDGKIQKLILRKPYNSMNRCSINTINARHTEIKRLSDISIHDLITVTELKVQDGSLSELDNTQEFLRQVQKLNVDGNQITQIPHNFMENLYNLKDLDLSENSDLIGEYGMFAKLKNLKYITLRYMKWTNVDPDWFYGLSNLEELDVSSNQLSSLNYEALVNHLPSLKLINIDMNYFSCDSVREMINYLEKYTQASLRTTGDEEMEHHSYYKRVHGILCDAKVPLMVSDYYWIGGGVVAAVAMITGIVLICRRDACKKCRNKESYDDVVENGNASADVKET